MDVLNVLIGCEFSGVVREAFRLRGHHAWSCDILPAADGSPYHIQDDVRNHLDIGWDLAIFHPPCTCLANSGVRWLYGGKGTTVDPKRWAAMEQGAALFLACLNAPIPSIAVENPVMHGHAQRIIGRGPDQTVQPWMFGHGEIKRTCFWLKNLPDLEPTDIVPGRVPRVHHEPPHPDRWKRRSITYQGIADAMASQWGTP